MTVDHILKAYSSLYPAINKELSDQSSKKYDNDKLTLLQLEEWRNDELPQIIASRHQQHNKVWITKDELVLLMDWKLAKGKFRPTLPKLIKSNGEDEVLKYSEDGFQILLSYIEQHPDFSWKLADKDTIQDYILAIKKAFKSVCMLKGVGPATASLILSLLTKINARLSPPFFSDESFLYFVVDAQRPGSKIKYNVKEYTDEFLPVYFSILKEYDTDMHTLEKGAWALKSFEINRIDKLINIKLDSDYKEEDLNSFQLKQEPEQEHPNDQVPVKDEKSEVRKRKSTETKASKNPKKVKTK
ncbi:uncharacterized protein CANTADRAFT_26692 [Suhomyces tanzawaensis NRRL Y-17324]|uniref:Uncharacterized protein n=1 Tax=Suhomyces tanzawaensis NRRL Y-17324 TaxID=984487 RepID=A0A1E4SGW4_9ASCO|nr:uncharacterized protein CANTADRAFT_26692 [Suhomyces tanzawaensis NRRL Y-17324]ODV78710.1 hypothetical protein CANTADRAFT_26692 [Suhomyces tanzawaensis NRRL Y-17324]